MRNRANSIAHGGGLCLLRPTLFSCLPYKSAHLEKEPHQPESIKKPGVIIAKRPSTFSRLVATETGDTAS